MASPFVPEHLIYPLDYFAADFERTYKLGESVWAGSDVAFVGLARNCAAHLKSNLARLEQLAAGCRSWRLHIETNDNDDGTDQVLADFCAAHRQATFTSQRLGRKQYTTEFAGRRTIALAEYRSACQRWVRESAADAKFVIVIDFDSWGGWSNGGVMAGIGSLNSTFDACGMASVSLMQYPAYVVNGQVVELLPTWMHYDAWALRLNSTYDDYTAGVGGWKAQWLPPVGSPPVPVSSAFGGMAIYDTIAYLQGEYDGSDCEHVTFHATMAERTGRRLYLCPSMRTVMSWIPDEGGHAEHNINSV